MTRFARRCGLSAALLLSLAGCESSSGDAPPAKAANPVTAVAALGKLEPRERVIDVSVAGDQRLSRIVVKEGQQVKTGDVLAYLQSFESLSAARARAAAQLADADARLQADTTQAKARIQEAALRLQQLKEVPELEIQAQKARIRETQSELDLAATNLERARSLFAADLMAKQEFDRHTAATTRLRAGLDTEQAMLGRLERAADTDRGMAEAFLQTRTSELDSIRAAAQVETFKAALQLADAQLRDAVVRAPSDGQIIEIVANPGESVFNRVILRLGDVSQMYALAEVYETDMARVRMGQSVEISSRALSEKLKGVVERMGMSVYKRQVRSVDPQADVDARVVQVRVRLDNSTEAARFVGLQVDLLFHPDN